MKFEQLDQRHVQGMGIDKESPTSDVIHIMSLDLNSLLQDWPHEAGAIKVRKIVGLDGHEKLQLRIDLGILQMELTGRPDGQRPHNCESLLVYHQDEMLSHRD